MIIRTRQELDAPCRHQALKTADHFGVELLGLLEEDTTDAERQFEFWMVGECSLQNTIHLEIGFFGDAMKNLLIVLRRVTAAREIVMPRRHIKDTVLPHAPRLVNVKVEGDAASGGIDGVHETAPFVVSYSCRHCRAASCHDKFAYSCLTCSLSEFCNEGDWAIFTISSANLSTSQ